MRTMLAMAIAVSLVAGMLSAASAADEKKANLQQERMKACNAPRRGPRRATSARPSCPPGIREFVDAGGLTPKSDRIRRVDMSAQLARVLQGLLAVREAEGILKEQAASPWLFVGRDGGPVTPGAFWQNLWRPLLKRSGVRYRKPHALRHTFASLLIQQGESLAYVRDQMGHHSIKMTVDIYGHLVPGANKAAVDRLDDATGRNLYATATTSR